MVCQFQSTSCALKMCLQEFKPFTSSHNQKEDNNQSKINKQPEVPENQTARNSDNQGIKETVNQTNQTSKTGRQKEPAARQWTVQVGLLDRKLGLRVDCGLQWLLRWEKLPVSHESALESGLESSRQAALFPLWPLPQRQHPSAARFSLYW